SDQLSEHRTALLAVPVHAEDSAPPALPKVLAEWVGSAREDARGRVGHVVVANTALTDGPRRVALIGAGGDDAWDLEAVRRFAGRAVRAAEARELTELSIVVPPGGLDVAE